MQRTISFLAIVMVLTACSPSTIIPTATEVPPTATVTETQTATATATPTETATATEAPVYNYNICPPETSDPRGCTLSGPDDLFNPDKFFKFLKTLTRPFSANTEKLSNPLPTVIMNPSDEHVITFVNEGTYLSGGPDSNLPVRLLGTSAYVEMNISGVTHGWFVYPMELQNPNDPTNKEANIIVIGIHKVKGPGIPRSVDKIAQIAPGAIRYRAVWVLQ